MDTKRCAGCGREFSRPQSCRPATWARRAYCSRQCGARFAVRRIEAPPDTKACVQCGSEFSRPPGYRTRTWIAQTHCSSACAGKTRSERARSRWAVLSCPMCGEEFRLAPGHAGRRVTCGARECVDRYASEIKGPKISARVKAEHDAGYRASVGGHSPREAALAPLLTGWLRNVRFIAGADAFELDFALLPEMLNVEIDGPEHAHPKRRKRDAERDSKLREMGWQTLRIPNADVDDDAKAVAVAVVDWVGAHRPIPAG